MDNKLVCSEGRISINSIIEIYYPPVPETYKPVTRDNVVRLIDGCDEYYYEDLTKEEFTEFIEALTRLRDQMK